jgi:hypothetical protein
MHDTGGIRGSERNVVADDLGRIADAQMFEHTARFERRY